MESRPRESADEESDWYCLIFNETRGLEYAGAELPAFQHHTIKKAEYGRPLEAKNRDATVLQNIRWQAVA